MGKEIDKWIGGHRNAKILYIITLYIVYTVSLFHLYYILHLHIVFLHFYVHLYFSPTAVLIERIKKCV